MVLAQRRGRRDRRRFVPATPNRHFGAAMHGALISSVDHLVNGGTIETPVIALRQQGQIRRFGFELGAQGAGGLGIGAMASGAIFHVFRLAFVRVLRQRTADRSHQKGGGAQPYRYRSPNRSHAQAFRSKDVQLPENLLLSL